MPSFAANPGEINTRLWSDQDRVAEYSHRVLRPVETVLLSRYHDALARRALEVGCGGGRILGYLVALGGEVHGIDISPLMVEHCRLAYPEAAVRVGDLRSVTESVSGRFDAILAMDNILDVLDAEDRDQVLRQLRDLLQPDGCLIFSSHNLAAADADSDASDRSVGRVLARGLRMIARTPPAQMGRSALRLPERVRNRRRLVPLQRRAIDHAFLNDSEGNYGALHYYVRRDDQERQLHAAGFRLIECLDVEGLPVAPGAAGDGPWLHYVATPMSPLP